MKKKSKVHIRFNAKPQPGYLVGMYVYPREGILNTNLIEFEYEDQMAREGNWDEVESCDIVLSSIIFPDKKTVIGKAAYSQYGLNTELNYKPEPDSVMTVTPPRFFLPSHNSYLMWSWYWELELLYYLSVNEKKELIFRYTSGKLRYDSSIVQEIVAPLVDNPKTTALFNDVWNYTFVAEFYDYNGWCAFRSPKKPAVPATPTTPEIPEVPAGFERWPMDPFDIHVGSYKPGETAGGETYSEEEVKQEAERYKAQEAQMMSEMTFLGMGVVRGVQHLTKTVKTEDIKIKEKKIEIDKETKEIKETELPDVASFDPTFISYSKEGGWDHAAIGPFPYTTYYARDYNWYSGNMDSGSDSLSWWLTYFGTIYKQIANNGKGTGGNDLYGSPLPSFQSMLPPGKIATATMIDKDGEKTIADKTGDYVKLSSKINGYEIPGKYVDPWDFSEWRQLNGNIYFGNKDFRISKSIDPVVIKCNDKDVYMIEKADASIIWKEGKEYVLPKEKKYEINGVTLDLIKFNNRPAFVRDNNGNTVPYPGYIASFPSYFCSRGMGLFHIIEDGYRTHYELYGKTGDRFNDEDYYHYMTTTWFGDYIYKVRTDELKDGSFILDRLIKSNYSKDFNKMLWDEGFVSIKSDMKIYRPETTCLWVEKYEVNLKEDLTADINYLTRFQASFTPPLDKTIDDIDKSVRYPLKPNGEERCRAYRLYSLKQIMYIPYGES